VRVLGLDPGLRHTGWGVIDADGNRLRHIANGVIHSDEKESMAERLLQLCEGVARIIAEHKPIEAAVEETFVNKNPLSTLKLGHARGVVMLAPAQAGIPVAEYSANLVKQSVVGNGHAQKEQVAAMIRVLFPGCEFTGGDAADALAVAVCHAHHASTLRVWKKAAGGEA